MFSNIVIMTEEMIQVLFRLTLEEYKEAVTIASITSDAGKISNGSVAALARPNIVIESASGEKDFIENTWIGKKVIIGEDVVLKVTAPCTRCVMTTLPQGDLPRDLGILRT